MTKQSTVFTYISFIQSSLRNYNLLNKNDECGLFWFCIPFSSTAFVLFRNYISHGPLWLAAVLDDSYPAPKHR